MYPTLLGILIHYLGISSMLMSDIDIGVLNAKFVSFADDTRLYSKISYVEDCDSLQSDLICIYCITSDVVNSYVSQKNYVIDNVNNLKDLGIIMFSNCSFEHHIVELCM